LAIPTSIIDSHVHLYDPREPANESAPFGTLPTPHPTEPQHLRDVAERHGIVGAIVIEASPHMAENQRLLDLAARDPYIIALVGNLDAGKPGFADRLAQHAGNPRFRGIRVGTPWCPLDLTNVQLIEDLRATAAADLAIDAVRVGGGDITLLEQVLALANRVPDLRIVIDHVPFDLPDDPNVRAVYVRLLRELGARPQIFAKASNILPRRGPIPTDPGHYAPILDELTGFFGDDRLMYGSNWPISARVAPYDRAFGVLAAYFGRRDPAVGKKFFTTNAQRAYGIVAP
jgi:L-fuconolactonase